MTTIAPAPGAGSPARATSKDAGTADVAPPVRLRRHPAWVWGGVATVFAGAVAGASLWSASSDANEILAAREPLTRGQIIEQDDLATVRVGLDPAVSSIPASELDAIVGQYAAMDVPAGGLLAAEQVTDQALPAQGQSVVGLSLTGAMVPTQHLQPGDKVRVVATAGPNGEIADTTTPESIPATVVGVSVDEVTGNLQVEVQVSRESGPRLALLATAGKAAVVLDSAED